MKFLSVTAQTAYSTLLDKAFDSRYARLANLGFTAKTVNGCRYWYCQYSDISGERRQRYVGPDDPTTRQKIEEYQVSQASAAEILSERKRLVAMVTAGGGTPEKGRTARIVEKLCDVGVFDGGGLLIGSHAFACYANLLGVVFDEAMRRTEDMDLAYDRSIEIGFVRDIRADIAEAAPGMSEPRQINPWVAPYEMIAPDGFKIEFLTTASGPQDKAPVKIERFGVNAQPLTFMDYLLSQPARAVVLYGAGVPVQVPDPARYAIHKLAVAQLRPTGAAEKRRKYLAQAQALIDILLDDAPGALLLATDAARARTDRFSTFIDASVKSVPSLARFGSECWSAR